MGELEQQYLQILLLEAMNSGRFSPREALWAHRWFARWCSEPGAATDTTRGCVGAEPKGSWSTWPAPMGSDGHSRQRGCATDWRSALPRLFALERDDRPGDGFVAKRRRCGRGVVCGARRAARTAEKLAILFAPNPIDVRAPRGAQGRCPGRPSHRRLSLHRRRIAEERAETDRRRLVGRSTGSRKRHLVPWASLPSRRSSLRAATSSRYRFR